MYPISGPMRVKHASSAHPELKLASNALSEQSRERPSWSRFGILSIRLLSSITASRDAGALESKHLAVKSSKFRVRSDGVVSIDTQIHRNRMNVK